MADEPAASVAAVGSADRVPTTPFVARERELATLDEQFARALAGQGRVVFVIGEAGSGKTALMAEFARRAMRARGDLLVATGRCAAMGGVGDPYLPFRELFRMLAADVEPSLAGGAIAPEHADRLLAALPVVARALVETGPDLLDRFGLAESLLHRAERYAPDPAPWRSHLEALAQRQGRRQQQSTRQSGPGLPQTALFEQATATFRAIARRHPLLLLLDDLQWVDRGSSSLLFHLGQRLARSAILVVGAYRPEEVAQGRESERHPLQSVVNELRRDLGEAPVDLSQAEGRGFVEALLDSEPNCLGPEFRKSIFRQTGGHALFTVELLQELRDRGHLVRDEGGRWVEGMALDWARLPVRVEAAIAERVGQLPASLSATLAVASVEGEEFTAEVVARVQGIEEEKIARALSGALSRRYQMVVPQSFRRMDGGALSRYRFRHYLFQQYLYGQLDEVERARLHGSVGQALETLHRAGSEEIAIQLAWHFELAGLPEKAVSYLVQAASIAGRRCGWEEAVGHLGRALTLLKGLPDTPERSRQEMAIHMALGGAIQGSPVWATPERAEACERAYELCRQIGAEDQIVRSLFLLADVSRIQGQLRKSLEICEQMLSVAEREAEPDQLVLAHYSMGETLYFLGNLVPARHHLREAVRHYDPSLHACLTSLAGADVGVTALTWTAWDTMSLGYPEQARSTANEALSLARQIADPLTVAFALALDGAGFELISRQYQAAQDRVGELAALVAEKRLEVMGPWIGILEGRSRVTQGEIEEGLRQMRQATDAWQANGPPPGTILQLLIQAETCLQHERWPEAARALEEARGVMERIEERGLEAELHRLDGELLLSSGANTGEAEGCFRNAIEVARRQEAKLWELRAATSLARLWGRQGKPSEARELLAPVYYWFTEGFDTPDLVDARNLLAEL